MIVLEELLLLCHRHDGGRVPSYLPVNDSAAADLFTGVSKTRSDEATL